MGTPAGAFSYAYDAAGRMTGLTNPFGETSSWQYLDNGWLWKQTLGNGAVTAYTYNALGLMTDLANRTPGGAGLSDFAVPNSGGYDGAGNRTALAATLPGAPTGYSGTTGYGYDAKDQLTQEQSTRLSGYTNAFGYDTAGNATTFRGASRSFNSDNQHSANTYDGNGNPTTYGGSSCAFDPESRATAFGSALTAGYTGEGLRAWKQGSAGRTYFLYDGDTPVCEIDASGTVTAANTVGASGLLSRRSGGASAFYTFDPSGNVAQRLSGTGAVLSSDAYDAFGSRVSTGGADVFGFGGQDGYYTDAETGLALCTHRYYDTSTGRWLTRDPIGYAGGVNLYGYTANNPIMGVDPLGLITVTIGFGGGAWFGPIGGGFDAGMSFDTNGTIDVSWDLWGKHPGAPGLGIGIGGSPEIGISLGDLPTPDPCTGVSQSSGEFIGGVLSAPIGGVSVTSPVSGGPGTITISLPSKPIAAGVIIGVGGSYGVGAPRWALPPYSPIILSPLNKRM